MNLIDDEYDFAKEEWLYKKLQSIEEQRAHIVHGPRTRESECPEFTNHEFSQLLATHAAPHAKRVTKLNLQQKFIIKRD